MSRWLLILVLVLGAGCQYLPKEFIPRAREITEFNYSLDPKVPEKKEIFVSMRRWAEKVNRVSFIVRPQQANEVKITLMDFNGDHDPDLIQHHDLSQKQHEICFFRGGGYFDLVCRIYNIENNFKIQVWNTGTTNTHYVGDKVTFRILNRREIYQMFDVGREIMEQLKRGEKLSPSLKAVIISWVERETDSYPDFWRLAQDPR